MAGSDAPAQATVKTPASKARRERREGGNNWFIFLLAMNGRLQMARHDWLERMHAGRKLTVFLAIKKRTWSCRCEAKTELVQKVENVSDEANGIQCG
ncbi:hypothetical protein [Herbaspirillum sp. CF444]|uniref:hypothetical protein n=1 Tax=Herbaspirillum sp. CF444 TaxID=1144319 RepID=UPI00138AD79F|nr:hypothetical protein [Herbaspirillum sp. CF444]